MSGSSFSGGKSKSKSKERVQIPEFLKPFLTQSAGVAGDALGNVAELSEGPFIADFAPAQEAAQGLAIQRALGGDGLIPGAQNTALDIAQGGAGAGAESIEQLLGQGVDPAALDALRSQASGVGIPGMEDLQGLLGSGLDTGALDTLRATAGGDFLMGGQGFDAAVDAAVRRAQPGILSAFGGAGRGASSGGLAQEAIGTAAVDAFASQFGQERGRQLGAANTLNQLGLSDRGQTADIASTLGNFGLAGGAQQIDAASQLGGLDLDSMDQQLRAALGLENVGLGQDSQRLSAAGMLPGLAEADVNLLSGAGGQQQQQEQARMDAPRQAQLDLLFAALSGLPTSALLGRDSSGKKSGFSFAGER